ncbi:PREDICTED: olfactory receptor 6C1-like [Nanorana parkeri]|uniref:olfactory receptor 6C1-like n=1 Tax=Nanorana parkeri TaxID=125878 RepID=UPI00085434F3|nr:PREDICTED: olfactory receptor 6C1-like [Nanorana parkeri]
MYVNQTFIDYFIIKGISDDPHLQLPIFLVVLLIYLITLCGNLTILIACRDPQLHTPMYFFLANLSVVDISCTTVSQHKILTQFITGHKEVSFFACMAQMYMFGSLQILELVILTAMSYDRYLAICKPLHYHIIMNPRMCVLVAAFCWLFVFLEILPPVGVVYSFSCYTTNEINHFFCDIVPLTQITCNDTRVLETLFFIEALFPMMLTPFLLTFASYVFIIASILKIRSTSGRLKAFYTCSSHLTVVILLYTTLFSQYLTPNLGTNSDTKKVSALLNTAAVPMLNPLIYSLKNKDVKAALVRGRGYSKTNH